MTTIQWTNVTRKLADLIPWAMNPREINEKQAERLEHSFKVFGQVETIAIGPDNQVYNGHQRLKVLLAEYGRDYVIECRQSSRPLTEREQQQLTVYLHEGATGQWDFDTLGNWDVEIDELIDWGFPEHKLIGVWEEEEQESSDANDSGVTEAEADKYQKVWQVKEGDVWKIGRHYLACLDSLDRDKVSAFLGDVDVDFIWADPPYGIDIVAANVSVGGGEAYDIPFGGRKVRGDVGGGAAHMRKTGKPYIADRKKNGLGSANAPKPFGSKGSDVRGTDGSANMIDVGKYAPVIGDDTTVTAEQSSSMCLEMYPDATQIWWGGNYYANSLPNSSCWLIWDKENTGNFADCELAWTNRPTAARIFKHMWNGLMKASEKGQRRVHPTQKPIALAKWAFEKYGNEGDVIYDPFLGSGISVLAAEELNDGRIVYGVDLAPAYIATTLQRYKDAFGIEPELIE